MFNREAKQGAISRLENACHRYEETARKSHDKACALHLLRTQSAEEVIGEADRYYSALANAPKEFGRTMGEYRVAFERFRGLVETTRENADVTATVTGSIVGAGTVAGIGAATLGPAAAMALATTFGTASTGAAIAGLSGAAAEAAAVAWLGGGAIAAGGGGMVAGEALLALAGPIGWGIGLAAMGGAGWYASKKNAQIAEEANSRAIEIEARLRSLEVANVEVDSLHELTRRHAAATHEQIARLRRNAPANYHEFTREQKEQLGAVKNNIESLSSLLAKTATAT
jgi:hypothetical protein